MQCDCYSGQIVLNAVPSLATLGSILHSAGPRLVGAAARSGMLKEGARGGHLWAEPGQ